MCVWDLAACLHLCTPFQDLQTVMGTCSSAKHFHTSEPPWPFLLACPEECTTQETVGMRVVYACMEPGYHELSGSRRDKWTDMPNLRSQEIKTSLQNVSPPYQSESLLCSLPISLGSGSAHECRVHHHHMHCFRSAALYPVRVHNPRQDGFLCVSCFLYITSTMNLKESNAWWTNLDNRGTHGCQEPLSCAVGPGLSLHSTKGLWWWVDLITQAGR